MTARSNEEASLISEELDYCQFGSFHFSQPKEVDHWIQSVPLGGGLPLTPPDTDSDCAISDCQDMSTQSLPHGQLYEEQWNTEPAQMDPIAFMRPPGSDWQNPGAFATLQDFQAVNTTAWQDTAHTGVDFGVSPALSYGSESSHAFVSFSEPDMPLMPSTSDVSLPPTPVWDPTGAGPLTFPPAMSSESCFVPAGPPFAHQSFAGSQPFRTLPYLGLPAGQPSVYVQTALQAGPQGVFPRRTRSYPATLVPQRPLLPRPESSTSADQPVFRMQRYLRPQPPAAERTQPVMPAVCSAPGQQYGVSAPTCPVSGVELVAYAGQSQDSQVPGLNQLGAHSSTLEPPSRTVLMAPLFDTPGTRTEDFGNFLHCGNSDAATSARKLSQSAESAPGPNRTMFNGLDQTAGVSPLMENSATMSSRTASVAAASLPSDNGEGRHRTDPLYSRSPQADGMFHCPWGGDSSCGHKPTKLKCNYDKYVDSHLKPFRCKVEACNKQSFSSTACLLRHEREAHGLHGHGDRPYVCSYAGCDRGHAGNGFPRKYNLYDHMKRVHDHKEDPASMDSSPIANNSPGHKKITGRKRKAPDSGSAEPTSQRMRTSISLPATQPVAQTESSTEFTPALGLPSPYGMTSSQPRKSPQRQRVLQTQWANQRDLVLRQMDFVQSPEDEAHLERISHNFEELRRLSQEARRA